MLIYPFEVIRGIMIISAAFIIAAVAILSFRSSRKYFEKWTIYLFLISLALGASVMAISLFWLREPSDSKALLALWLLVIQFIIYCIPVFKVIISMGNND